MQDSLQDRGRLLWTWIRTFEFQKINSVWVTFDSWAAAVLWSYKFGWLVSWLVNKTYTNKWKPVCKVNFCVLEWNSFLFWSRNIAIHHKPSHTIWNGHMIHCLRLENIRNTQYLLIRNTKQFRHKYLLAFLCITKHQKALSVTALYIFDVWAAQCYWQLLFHLVNVGMKNFQLLLCLTSKRYDLLSFADGIDSFLHYTPKIIIHWDLYLSVLQNHYTNWLCTLLFLTENNTAIYEGILCWLITYLYMFTFVI